MPLQQLAPMPQPQGLSMLGSVILNASERAANERQKKSDLADARARQDALLKDERAYQKEQTADTRRARLEDDLALNAQREKAAAVQALINEGILRYEDKQNEQAIAAAYKRAQELGIIEKYKTLIEGGYLKAEEAGDAAKVTVAMNAAGGTAATERTRKTTLQERGDTQASEVAHKLAEAESEERQVIQHLQELDKIVSTGGMPAQADVLREATRRVNLRVPGRKVVPNEEIAAEVPRVTEDLRNQRLDAAAQQQGILQRQLEGVRSIRAALSSQQNVLSNRGSFPVPEPAAPAIVAPPTAQAPAARPSGSPMGGFLQQLEQEAARNPMPPAPPPPIQQGQPGWVPPSSPPGLPSGFTPPMRSASTGGRPITPSANIFPTSPSRWWSAA